ncbi:MAG: PQQ-like beta-propeller repeat protein [Planctomycetaceae bacterium]|nr:PQQ-like beta-propeller repeat protein [Planctomycetaceae bacterium]
MNDQDHKPESEQPASPSNEQTAPPKKRNWLRAWGVPVFLLLTLSTSFYWVRFVFDPLDGQGWVNLMTVIVVGSQTILLLLWFSLLSYFTRRTVWSTLLILFLTAFGWGASIRNVEHDGDMNVSRITYRWDPLPVPLQVAPENQEALEMAFAVQPYDVPAFRGSNRDGIITGPLLRTDWEQKPLKEIWRTPVGAGYASMSVVGASLLTIEQRELSEAITCYDKQTGKLRWVYEYPAQFFEAMGGIGPRTTPTVSQGYVVSMGAAGDVTCLDFQSGKLIWSRNVLKELKIPNVMWGMSSSPLVYDQTVCINPGGPQGNGLMGLSLEDGSTIWQCEGLSQYDEEENKVNLCGYSSPMIREVDGIKQIIMFDGHGLSGHDLASGKQLWHHPYQNPAGVNAAQPIVLENQKDIFISTSYSMGSALITVEQATENSWKITPKWHDERVMRSKFSNPVYFQGYVYGLDEGILMCIDPLTGKKQWKKGRFGHGQLLLTGNQLLVLAVNGDLAIVEADPKQYQELARQKVLPQATKVWNPHALVDGIVYLRDHAEMAAFDLR